MSYVLFKHFNVQKQLFFCKITIVYYYCRRPNNRFCSYKHVFYNAVKSKIQYLRKEIKVISRCLLFPANKSTTSVDDIKIVLKIKLKIKKNHIPRLSTAAAEAVKHTRRHSVSSPLFGVTAINTSFMYAMAAHRAQYKLILSTLKSWNVRFTVRDHSIASK